MNKNSTDGFTRRQAIAGAGTALAGLTIAAKTTLAQTETIPQPTTPLQVTPLFTEEELGLWTLDFATEITKGKSLSNCLTICSLNTKNAYLRRISDNVLKIVNMGYTLSSVMELNGDVFDKKYVATVRYGESYAILDESLKKMLEQRFKIAME